MNFQVLVSYLKARMNTERGASAVEYALLIGLIAAIIVVTVAALGTKVSGIFTSVTNTI